MEAAETLALSQSRSRVMYWKASPGRCRANATIPTCLDECDNVTYERSESMRFGVGNLTGPKRRHLSRIKEVEERQTNGAKGTRTRDDNVILYLQTTR